MQTAPVLACALAAGVVGLAGCAALLDWNGYSGGGAKGSEDGGDASPGVGDAGDAGRDAPVPAPDGPRPAGPPACGPSTCGGCCNAQGFCAGGQSKGTCGTGGETCVDCVASSLVCSDGKCVAPVVDAGPPPPCDPNACPFDCAPVYQITCCKSDNTCGCAVEIPTTGPCM